MTVGALDDAFPGFVLTLEAAEPARTAARIRRYRFTPPPAGEFFAWAKSWLSTHDACEFLS